MSGLFVKEKNGGYRHLVIPAPLNKFMSHVTTLFFIWEVRL